MKYKLKLVIACAIFSIGNLDAQQVQTGVGTGPTAPSMANSTRAWFRGGNTLSGAGGADNVFGTMWNSPIYTKTNTAFREKLNGDFTAATQYPINGYTGFSPIPVNTSGYLLLGPNTPSQLGGNIYDVNRGAFSLLHLNGIQNSVTGAGFAQELGYRPWMKTGITYTGNNDLMYMGIRALAPGQDQTEMVISWADNAFPTAGPDDFAFRFMGTGASNVISTNVSDENDLDGRHIARFVPTGEMGLGNTFGPPGAPYVRPQNLLHMSLDLQKQVFMQITNQLGTGQAAGDGLLVGYAPTSAINLEARINQQENDRLSLYANNGERIRIMQIGALNNGVAFNPGALATNLTRIGVSHNPTQPVTRPLSLMHLGYNTGATNDGWRNWMDVGTFTASGSDNMYVGLKQEPGAFPIDRYDAVINWGDNGGPTGPFPLGPDNLRFIFTSTTSGAAPSPLPASGANGVEGMRMTPSTNVAGTFAHVWTGIGGDPTPGGNGYGPAGTSINPTQTLEVNSSEVTSIAGGSSGLRFTNLNITSPTIANPGDGILAVNANGDVIYVPDVTNSLGNLCGATPNPLMANYQIPMAGNSIYMHGGSSIQIGDVTPCTAFSPARLYVRNSTGLLPEGLRVETSFPGTVAGHFVWPGIGAGNFAGLFDGDVRINGVASCTAMAWTSDSMFKTDVNPIKSASGILRKLKPHTYKMDVINFPQFNFENDLQYGFIAQEVELVLPELIHESVNPATTDSLGNIVYPSVAFKSLNYNAFIPIAVQAINELGSVIDRSTLSDQSIKTNVQNLSGSLAKVKQMRGVTYEWSNAAQSNMDLDSLSHVGFIAQEIAAIEPLLTFVDDSSLMHVNYDRVVPMLVESIIDLDAQVQAKDSAINSLQTQINQLADLINACCTNRSATNSTGAVNAQDVNLKDGQTIVLEQNVPNPFAEQTTIDYFLPETVVKAQMLFYNAQGKLIQSVDLNQKGKGSLNVFASDLSNGVYTYTLVVDGGIIETKKMVKQQ